MNKQLVCRGLRGATTTAENSDEAILSATRELLYLMQHLNSIDINQIASIYFTTTKDLNATYPALAARQLGWSDIALLCAHEMDVPNGLPLCIRVLIHWNTTRTAKELIHLYLHDAQTLRPDRQQLPEISLQELESLMRNYPHQ